MESEDNAARHHPADADRDAPPHGASDDPIDGDPAIADHGVAGADRAGVERESRPGRSERIGAVGGDGEEDCAGPRPRAGADAEPNEFDSLINLDENWSEIYDEGPRRSRAALSEDSDRKQDAMQNMASRPRSFHDDLIDQLSFFDCDPTVRELAEYIIYNLDEKGYFRLRLARRGARPQRLGPRWSRPRRRFKLVQRLDPARRRRPRPARMPAAAAHAGHALPRCAADPDLPAPRRPGAQPPAGHREEDGNPAREDQGGDRAPAPAEFPARAASFATDNPHYVIPDLIVEHNDQGGYDVRLVDENTPHLAISRYYQKLLRNKQTGPKRPANTSRRRSSRPDG